MRFIKNKIIITALTNLSVVLFMVFSYNFPEHLNIAISLELTLLPLIFIVGNQFIENSIHKYYEEKIENLTERSSEINQKYYKQKIVIEKLRNELRK